MVRLTFVIGFNYRLQITCFSQEFFLFGAWIKLTWALFSQYNYTEYKKNTSVFIFKGKKSHRFYKIDWLKYVQVCVRSRIFLYSNTLIF